MQMTHQKLECRVVWIRKLIRDLMQSHELDSRIFNTDRLDEFGIELARQQGFWEVTEPALQDAGNTVDITTVLLSAQVYRSAI
jgi:hypothetical protein